MENATKALLIAGALLLTIAIIAIGMMIYTQSQSIVTDVPLDSFIISSHNNRFLVYTGKVQKGSSIMGIPSETLAYNKSLTNELMRVSIYLELLRPGSTDTYEIWPLLLTERTIVGGTIQVQENLTYAVSPSDSDQDKVTTLATYSDNDDLLIEQNLNRILSTEQYKLVASYSQDGYIVKIRIRLAN